MLNLDPTKNTISLYHMNFGIFELDVKKTVLLLITFLICICMYSTVPSAFENVTCQFRNGANGQKTWLDLFSTLSLMYV